MNLVDAWAYKDPRNSEGDIDPITSAASTDSKADNSREWYEVLGDVGMGMLRTAAAGGNGLQILAGGVVGGVDGDPAEKAAKRQELADENARLRNESLRQSMRLNEEANSRSSRQAQEQSERNKLLNEQTRQNMRHAKEAHLVNQQLQENNLKVSAIALQKLQVAADKDALDKEVKVVTEQWEKQVGFADKSFLSQHILRSAPGVQNALRMQALTNVYLRDPEQGKRLLYEAGWQVKKDENGEPYLLSVDGSRGRPFNDREYDSIVLSINEKYQAAVEAAELMGNNSLTSMAQVTARNTVETPDIIKYFTKTDANGKKSVDYVKAVRDYKSFLRDGMQKGVFNEQDMIVHQLSRSLQTALIDKKLSPQETQLLAPQFEMYLQKFNARVEFSPDGDINKTKIVKRSGDAVDILKFAQDMQMLDPVMKDYESFLAQRQAKANVALLAAAEADLKRREQRAKTIKAEQEAGIVPGESTGSGMEDATRPLTKNEQNKYVKIYGADFLTLPNDVQANIKQVENAIDKEAEDLGLIAQDEKGNYVMPDAAKIKNMQDRVKWARKNLPAFKDMAEKERDIYADNGMEDIAGNGRWNLLVKNLSAVDTLYKAKERKERITANKKDLDNVAKAVQKQPWYLRGFGMGAVNQAQQGTAFAKFFNDNKGKTSEKEANATKKKIEKNRAARKNKQ